MTSHRSRKSSVQAYRRCLEQLALEAERWIEIVFEQQADLAQHLAPEAVQEAQLEDGPTDLVTDLWSGTDELALLLAGVVAFAREARLPRRRTSRQPALSAHDVWQQLRSAALSHGAKDHSPDRVLAPAGPAAPELPRTKACLENDSIHNVF